MTIVKAKNNRSLIVSKFSRYADTYNNFARVQKFAATSLDNLVASLKYRLGKQSSPQHILEIGCGTGLLSQHLIKRFPHSSIEFLDPADNMLRLCQENLANYSPTQINHSNHIFTMKSIEEFLADRNNADIKYDLIISSFTFQWLSDLTQVIYDLLDNLNTDGKIIFSYPTNKSFPEWKTLCQKLDLPYSGNILPNPEELKRNLLSNKAKITSTEYSLNVPYPYALDFFRQMKYLGATSPLEENKKPLTIKQFKQLLNEWDYGHLDKRISNTDKQEVNCTYWFDEGIITPRN